MMTFWDWIESLTPNPSTRHRRPNATVGCEGLLVPDSPGVPGVSRINTSLFPRSRYRLNPTLRPPKPRLPKPPTPPKPGL